MQKLMKSILQVCIDTPKVSATWQGLRRLHCQDCIEIALDPECAEGVMCESSNHRPALVFTESSAGSRSYY